MAPALIEAVDPRSAVIGLASGDPSAARFAAITGWVLLSGVAGALSTRRRDVA